MNAENYSLNKLLNSKEKSLESAESIIVKYRELLETSVEHL